MDEFRLDCKNKRILRIIVVVFSLVLMAVVTIGGVYYITVFANAFLEGNFDGEANDFIALIGAFGGGILGVDTIFGILIKATKKIFDFDKDAAEWLVKMLDITRKP